MTTGNDTTSQTLSTASTAPMAHPAPRTPPHPLALAVAALLHASRDVEECVAQYVPLALDRHRAALDDLKTHIEALGVAVARGEKHEHGALMREIVDSVNRLERWALSAPGDTLRIALLLRLFSAYDTFLGSLLLALFEKKPDLLLRLGGEVKVAVILKTPDLDSFKRTILNDYIDGFRRESYADQFKALEKLADIATLTAFANWPSFVEAGQRRNLFAHCGGQVSEQYLTNCRSAGVSVPAGIKPGDALSLDDAYLLRASRLVMEVSLKLTQTLWRKLVPDELADADSHLHHVAYQGLQLQEWDWAEMIGHFACELPRHSNEQAGLIALVNRAIAAKQRGDAAESERLLKPVDWSAKAPEFKLAVAVLLDRYDEASEIMRRIGKRGELLEEAAYHTWPLFRDFRGSPQFLDSYEIVYGYAFVQELKPETSRLEEAAAGRTDNALSASVIADPPQEDAAPSAPIIAEDA